MNKLDVDAIIKSLLNSGGKDVRLIESDILTLYQAAKKIFME